MPTPQQYYESFLADVRGCTRKFTKSRSSLRGLCQHLEREIGTNNPRHFDPDDGDPAKAFNNAKGKCANPNDSRLTKYEPALRRLVKIWGNTRGLPYPLVPVAAQNNVSARDAVTLVRDKLDEMKTHASMDAFAGCPRENGRPKKNAKGDEEWTGFAVCINPDEREEVLRRHDDADKRGVKTGGGAGGGMPNAFGGPPNVAWNDKECETAYAKVYGQGAGVCTLFAKAAGHVLATMLTHGPRLEIVAYKNHVFVIVGRVGGYANNRDKLPPYATWNGSWCIVDGWAGAMGFEVCYLDKANGFPYKAMLDPLTLVMEKEPW